jgi:hypothetical protein
MALQPINIGATGNDGTGDAARTAFQKVNANDNYLLGLINTVGGSAAYYVLKVGSKDTSLPGTVTNGEIALETGGGSINKLKFPENFKAKLDAFAGLGTDFEIMIQLADITDRVTVLARVADFTLDGQQYVVAVNNLIADTFSDAGNDIFISLDTTLKNSENVSNWEIIETNNYNLKLPTLAEWQAEYATWASSNASGAFSSVLKLPRTGFRNWSDGIIQGDGTQGYYWSSSVNGTLVTYLTFSSAGLSTAETVAAVGASVRLIIDGNFTQQNFDDDYDGVTVNINGLDYGFVYNSTTQKIWLDRNLGATQVATGTIDALGYGHLFQWGRNADGHEVRTSGTTTIQSDTLYPTHSDFVITNNNWLLVAQFNLWQGVAGINNPGKPKKLRGKNNLKADYNDLSNKPNIESSPLTTIGDLYTYSTENARLPVGTDGQILEADSAEPTGLKWVDKTVPKEQDIVSTVVEPTIVAGAYTFDITLGRAFKFDITENTTLTPPTLANSTALSFTALVSGEFTLTVNSVTVTPSSNTYDGAILNRLIFDCYRTSAGVQTNILTLENLA